MPLVYHSGSLGATSHRARFIDICEARLLSCHGDYLATAKQWLADAHSHPLAKLRSIMLDSGAFTGWSRGEHITLPEVMWAYSAIVNRYAPFYKRVYLINLDVIPGSRGVTPTRAQIDAALVESDKNFEALTKEFGDVVLPVFHQGESPERLHEVAAQNNYICVSPRNDLSESQRLPWAQRVHHALRIAAPHVVTHGLAATGVKMMLTTGFYSVDSATWVKVASNGSILVETGADMRAIRMSGDDGRFHDADIKLTIERQAESIGITIDELRNQPGGRELFNVSTLARVSSRVKVGFHAR